MDNREHAYISVSSYNISETLLLLNLYDSHELAAPCLLVNRLGSLRPSTSTLISRKRRLLEDAFEERWSSRKE